MCLALSLTSNLHLPPYLEADSSVIKRAADHVTVPSGTSIYLGADEVRWYGNVVLTPSLLPANQWGQWKCCFDQQYISWHNVWLCSLAQ